MKNVILILILIFIASKPFCQCGAGLQVVLTTQSEVDSFLTSYCPVFEGSLRVESDADGLDPISTLASLSGLKKVGGILQISGLSLEDFEGLDSLEEAGSVRIFANEGLRSLRGLRHLISVTGDVWVSGNANLENVAGLQGLLWVGGALIMQDNDALRDIDSLQNLLVVKNIFITDNASLTSIQGIANVFPDAIENNPLDIDDLIISDNAGLSTCSNEFLCRVLLRQDIDVEIVNNLPGCNSAEEVLLSCTTRANDESFTDTPLIYPNPAREEVYIRLDKTSPMILYNIHGRAIQNQDLTAGINLISLTGIQPGIYLLRIGNQPVRKIIKTE